MRMYEAKSVLFDAGIAAGQDFDSLSSDQFGVIRSEAAAAYERKHGKAMPEDCASYIRKRYELLQMRAAR